MNAQIIEKNGQPEWAVIPYPEYQKMQEAYQDAKDIQDIENNLRAIEEGEEIAIPGEVTFAILEGINPIRAWRNYKKIKMKDLAEMVGISSAYLSQIENNKRNPTIETLKAIANFLEVDIEMLI